MKYPQTIFINYLSFAYDWLYNELPDYLKTDIAKMLERHLVRWYEVVAKNKNINKPFFIVNILFFILIQLISWLET